MLRKISRGNHVYCAHTMSAKIISIYLTDGTYQQVTFIMFMEYEQYRPRIMGVDAQKTLFHIFFSVKSSKKADYTKNLLQHV